MPLKKSPSRILFEVFLYGFFVVVALGCLYPFWVVVVLTVIAVFLGPVATLGFVFAVIGSSMVVDRRKQSAHWQQGFLGLGIGTTTSIPFDRIDHIAVTGDYDEQDIGGRGHDFVTWDVEIVRDDGRRNAVGSVIAARPLADVGLDRANRLAEAVGEMAAAEARLEALPEYEEYEETEQAEQAEAPRRRRRVERATLPPPEEASPEGAPPERGLS